MKKPELSLVPNTTPEKALERMKELTRRIIAVPKSDLPTKMKAKAKNQRKS